MFGTTFNSLQLHRYLTGNLTQAQILALFSVETSATLSAASASYALVHG